MAYTSIWEEAYQEAVIQPFLDAHPGVSVNYVSKRTSAEMLSALQAEKANPTTDVVIMDSTVSASANTQGIFEKFDESAVPNLANVKEEFLDPDGYGPYVMLDAIALLYDTEVIDQAPTSWEVLWDPQYAGQLNITAPPALGGIALTAIAASMEGEDYTESIDKALVKLKELAPSVQTWAPNPDEYQNVISGQTVMGMGPSARAQYYTDQVDGKLGIVFPTEGTTYQINTVNLVEGSDNKAVAEAFIDYSLSPEAQLAFAERMFYAPSIDVDVPADIAARVVPTDGSLTIIPLDNDFLHTARDEWTDIWKREIIRG
ncbi:ABC transporter substrate-binding protein [Microbacterium sp. YY-01]|uniref:ABC transporter substrate-binding protein n=1 Tax=Microbacterium sp. YY-01 TaxID=3421634 RepID=UPI003D16B2B2